MVGPISVALALYELVAWTTGLPTITRLARGRLKLPILVWWAALGIHFLTEEQ